MHKVYEMCTSELYNQIDIVNLNEMEILNLHLRWHKYLIDIQSYL